MRKGYQDLIPYFNSLLSGESINMKEAAATVGVSYGHAIRLLSVYIREQQTAYKSKNYINEDQSR